MTESAAPSNLETDYYLERVSAALADLPAEVRDDLLEDLPAHFAEVLAEQGGSLVDRLGPPAAYAAELRAAAGLEPVAAAAKGGPLNRLAPLVARTGRWLSVVDRRVGQLIGYPRAWDFLVLLRPAWWIARAVCVVVLIFAADIIPTDRLDDPIGWLFLAVAIVISVRMGATGRPRTPRWLGWAGTAVAVIGALVVLADWSGVSRVSSGTGYYDRWSYVTDVFPVDSSGRPLRDVSLYDQDGNPIQLGDYWRCAGGPESQPPSYPLCHGPQFPSLSPTDVPTTSGSPAPSASASASVQPSGSVSPSASVQPSVSPSG
ncbi:hypothetical protein KZZ52_55710 [Dactylosporangium sp. AC04546]|uniref:HAAS signaling domain-containing protein n=1 Tax=Dactylosporangium sp. AC04546 TaxID=2862460 RepID=UPI001EDEE92B|nr:hypothetical protein [Dactylosporangium sp. AC04546]WVK83073.1 hypothetical protein KZZ52_55710 [Dactylosporangium sp. AC04546]